MLASVFYAPGDVRVESVPDGREAIKVLVEVS